jgi:hypothetical protein
LPLVFALFVNPDLSTSMNLGAPMQEKPMILYDSPEAASIKTVTGWLSSIGRFWGNDEHMARYDGSTHRKCETEGCSSIIPQHGLLYCRDCMAIREKAKFEAKPKAAWDGHAMLFSDSHDEYFNDLDEAEDFAEDHEETLADLRLIICEPNRLREVDAEHWIDDLPEDGELPDEVLTAIDALNEVIRAAGPCSWSPGKFALDLSTITARA